MKDLIVIMGATSFHGTLRHYLHQLSCAGIPVHIEDLSNQPFLHRGGNIGEKIELLRGLVQRFADWKHIIFTDAFDVTFYGRDRDEVISRIRPIDQVIFGAEKNYYPDFGLRDQIPDQGPWRFVNGGLSAGTPEIFWKLFDALVSHPDYNPNMIDQGFLNTLLTKDQANQTYTIDWQTSLFFCLFGGYDELEFVKGEPHNTHFDTWPLFMHANGKWPADEMFHRYHESL